MTGDKERLEAKIRAIVALGDALAAAAQMVVDGQRPEFMLAPLGDWRAMKKEQDVTVT